MTLWIADFIPRSPSEKIALWLLRIPPESPGKGVKVFVHFFRDVESGHVVIQDGLGNRAFESSSSNP